MVDTHETTADIIAEMRRRAEEIERDCAEKMKRGEMVSDCYARELVADIRREADRLEAAHKRELIEVATRAATQGVKLTNEKYANMPIGNSAALREALKAAELGLFRWQSGSISRDEHRELVATIKTALAEPPRNCDRYSHDEALQVWSSEKENECNGCFDEWLYEIAKEGGAK
jgi:hypothetical protein